MLLTYQTKCTKIIWRGSRNLVILEPKVSLTHHMHQIIYTPIIYVLHMCIKFCLSSKWKKQDTCELSYFLIGESTPF